MHLLCADNLLLKGATTDGTERRVWYSAVRETCMFVILCEVVLVLLPLNFARVGCGSKRPSSVQ